MTSMTYADILRPATRERALAYDAALALGGSLALALSAKVSAPFFPVPITAQTLVVLLLGALLGARRGAMAVLAYLAEGASGLPVFAGGMAGPLYMAGPTGGYLVGFVGAAWLTGRLAEYGWDRRTGTTVLAMLAGDAVLFAAGVAWLSLWCGFIGTKGALAVGLWIFLPGEALKIAAAALALPAGGRLLGRTGRGR